MKNSFWSPVLSSPDSHVLFRGHFHLASRAEVEIRVVGSAWYQAWLNGKPLLEGPFRFALERPEYQSVSIELPAGEHVLAFHAHHIGFVTRILQDTPPFLWCETLAGGDHVEVSWRCHALESQVAQTRRINPQLGWIDWRDTRLEPVDWEQPSFDDSKWVEPTRDASALPDPLAADLASVQTFPHSLKVLAEGPLATTFGYAADEPAYVFYSRDRVCNEYPATGIWRRYDLGRVRLGRPSFLMDLPAGTVIEFAMAEQLSEGRVSPYINFSAGTSCNMDRFVARGGEQLFCPLTPKGGRFLEVHVVNACEGVRFLDEQFLERCYYTPTEAAFSCGDALLEKIWYAGAETHRACSEDALTDNPTRERGQWTGDSAAVGLNNASVLFHDSLLCRRALVHAALCAREDGMVAAVSPGTCYYMSTYSFLWVGAVCRHFQQTGDRGLLEELWPAAVRNMEALEPFLSDEGLRNEAGQIFIDWGYQIEEPADTATNLLLLHALREMTSWASAVGQEGALYCKRAEVLEATLRARLQAKLASGSWPAVGYHAAALALMLGLVEDENACLDHLAHHLLDCFPNNPDAPRNDDPLAFKARVITPYFAHFVFPLFFERGRTDFVLDQYRQCWGWLLNDGRTTLPEVFDTRWSHCHQWSGCPTWQMSRYLLGLRPRYDLAADAFEFCLSPGSLSHASGRLPHPQGGWIEVSWQRQDEDLHCRISTPAPLQLHFSDGEVLTVQGESDFSVPVKASLRTR